MVISSNPTIIQQAIRLSHRLTDQEVTQGTLPHRGALSKTTDNKRKFDSSFPKTFQSNPPSQQQQQQHRKLEPSKNNNQSTSSQQNQGSYVGKYPKCNKCNFHHHGACDRYRCHWCGKMGHLAKDCRVDLQNKHTSPKDAPKGCFECGKEGHFKKNCPQLRRNGNGNACIYERIRVTDSPIHNILNILEQISPEPHVGAANHTGISSCDPYLKSMPLQLFINAYLSTFSSGHNHGWFCC
ncbi:hypothetical protein L1987_64437 [Smallanthus sonchifolius]|uniref:Uncharacterized protein n=1 Tax=Smallanthus sonchifolius TaxID=185202 RepID=A0ACB9CFZ3_9ASTR|nr:hypothetical protein L1987_64437 [Smallanthus sonchifolius]